MEGSETIAVHSFVDRRQFTNLALVPIISERGSLINTDEE
jgi:hypothetical protein